MKTEAAASLSLRSGSPRPGMVLPLASMHIQSRLGPLPPWPVTPRRLSRPGLPFLSDVSLFSVFRVPRKVHGPWSLPRSDVSRHTPRLARTPHPLPLRESLAIHKTMSSATSHPSTTSAFIGQASGTYLVSRRSRRIGLTTPSPSTKHRKRSKHPVCIPSIHSHQHCHCTKKQQCNCWTVFFLIIFFPTTRGSFTLCLKKPSSPLTTFNAPRNPGSGLIIPLFPEDGQRSATYTRECE